MNERIHIYLRHFTFPGVSSTTVSSTVLVSVSLVIENLEVRELETEGQRQGYILDEEGHLRFRFLHDSREQKVCVNTGRKNGINEEVGRGTEVLVEKCTVLGVRFPIILREKK